MRKISLEKTVTDFAPGESPFNGVYTYPIRVFRGRMLWSQFAPMNKPGRIGVVYLASVN